MEDFYIEKGKVGSFFMRKIIIDCDPGIDDALAIMLAVNSPELEIVAITTVSGNVPSDMGAVNAKKVLKQLNRLDIPVYIGEDAPLREEYIDARDTHGMDGLGESFLPEVSSGCEKQSAVDFLTEILEKEKISIIALGPMTNLAKVFSKKPELIQNVEELFLWEAISEVMETVHRWRSTITGVTRMRLPLYMIFLKKKAISFI